MKKTSKERYAENPNYCKYCGEITPFYKNYYESKNKKFCNTSCSNTYNNKMLSRRRSKARNKKKYIASEWEERIKDAISKTDSMAAAGRYLNLERKTFKRLAVELGVFKPNQNKKTLGKGRLITTNDVLNNIRYLRSCQLKKRLFNEGYKKQQCEICENTVWNETNIPLELHHIDGNKKNNKLENLEILCPNCHAQTDNFRRSTNKK